MKKLISAALVLALVLSLSLVAVAAPEGINSMAIVGTNIPGVNEWDPADAAGDMEEVEENLYVKVIEFAETVTMSFKFVGNDFWDNNCDFGCGSETLRIDGVRTELACGAGSESMLLEVDGPCTLEFVLDLTAFAQGGSAYVSVTDITDNSGSNVIETVEITGVTAPSLGATADWSYVLPDGVNYEEGPSVWSVNVAKPESYSDIDDGSWNYSGDNLTFEADVYYSFVAILNAGEGYTFSEDLTATINGLPALLDSSYGDHVYVYLPFDALQDPNDTREMITSVEVSDVAVPAVGYFASWDYGCPAAAPYRSAGCAWAASAYEPIANQMNNLIWHYGSEGDLEFEGGLYYTVKVVLEAEDGYRFNAETTATLNGEEALAVYDGNVLNVYYTFDPLEGSGGETEFIENIEIMDVAVPVPGENANWNFTVSEDAPYLPYIDSFGDMSKWILTTTKPENLDDYLAGEWLWGTSGDYVFESGYYSFGAQLAAKDGYAFSQTVTATINGQKAVVEWVDDSYVVVYLTFDELGESDRQVVESIDITGVTAPSLGADADWNCELPANAPYGLDRTNWTVTMTAPENCDDIDRGDWYFSGDQLTFKAGRYYSFVVVLDAEGNTVFSDEIAVTINGKTAMVDNYGDRLYAYLPFDPLDGPVDILIEKVSVTVPAPAIGESASWDFAFPAGNGYIGATNLDGGNAAWFVLDSEPESIQDFIGAQSFQKGDTLVFEEGKWYAFAAILESEDGYEFARSLFATINGIVAMTETGENLALVMCSFGVLEETILIENVEITGVTAPSLGADADWGFEIPEGKGYAAMTDGTDPLAAWAIGDTAPADFDELMSQDGKVTGDELKFEAGKYYTFVTLLEPEDGYSFAYDAIATVNGREAKFMFIEGMMYVAYTYEPLTEGDGEGELPGGEQQPGGGEQQPGGGEQQPGGDDKEDLPETGDLSVAAVAVALMAAAAGMALTIGKKKEF